MPMKALSCFSLTLFIIFQLNAQCDYDVSVDGDLLLCPNSSGQLTTQEFESYQWMKRAYNENEASPIDGATEQFLDITAFDDAGYYFSVEITHENCTEASEEVLVDGWVFLPVTVISLGNFEIGETGGSIICEGDSMFFEMGAPYTENITWYKNGSIIPDETSIKLTVKESGNYTVSGAPAVCPDFIQNLGLELSVETINCNTNIDPVENDLEVQFYPNPTNERAFINSTETIDKYSVISSDGKMMFDQMVDNKEFEINLSSLSPGWYLLQINAGPNLKTIKFIIQ